MRAYLPDYELAAPGTLADALALLGDPGGGWRPFAGGTDLMVVLDAGALEHRRFVSLWGLPDLRGIQVTATEVVLGALVTYAEILAHPVLAAEFPALGQAASQTGGVATQNRGTVGGNIANASPAADTPPVLLACDASLDLASARGERRVRYDGFHTGYKRLALEPGEIIARIRLPRREPGWVDYYRKVGTRRAQAISKVCIAASARRGSDGALAAVRVALGSVAPTVVRCAHVEAALAGRVVHGDERVIASAADALGRDIAPIDDIRSTAAYRAAVARNLVVDFLKTL